jgi:predicted nucleic acid-binding protein
VSEHLYVDASAVVKRFRDEIDSDVAIAAMDRASVLRTSRVTFIEVGRAIGAVAEGDEAVLRRWNMRWAEHEVIEVDDDVARHALALACYHGLRSSDAVHLASALTLKVPMRFATWDARLWEAARAVGLRVVPATKPGVPAPA